MNHFSLNLKKIRQAKRMSLEELALKTNYELDVLHGIEEGVLEPDIHLLVLMSDVLRSNPNELLGYSLTSYSSVYDVKDIHTVSKNQ
ncbi:helix-turn-helix domain-containing protein [Erysipelothrix urinaevulpis]|uniref:helix-turn-helix domain-containing protein n=1 Tax=Erysipelothrix urinaevulpis TaxID=2683717 RepID=UPI00135B6B94|nr:helix-turn-helix transcriptional regulator [Erysipelothrix urinaevulpis]